MTPSEFLGRFGYYPLPGDIPRATCEETGTFGHWFCGVCVEHDRPRFTCGCAVERLDDGTLAPLPGERVRFPF